MHCYAIAITLCCLCADVSPPTNDMPAKPPATSEPNRIPGIVYIPTPHDVVERMLRLANVTRDDTLYDLGCGDGRIVIAAAKRHGCRGVGIDIDPRRVKEAKENVRRNRLEERVEIRRQDLFETDLREATVVMLYLSSGANERLIPSLRQLPPGSRVVSHQFAMKGITPDRVIRVRSKEDKHVHTLYLWTTPFDRKSDGSPPSSR